MSKISPVGLQENGDIIDLNGEIITKEERQEIIDKVGDLPIQEYIEKIMETVNQSVVTIIQAETGSGKTTQVPKMLSQAMGYLRKIIVTEPRVIAAIAAARRISKELISFTGDPSFSIGSKVGYRTGKEKISSHESEITMVTDGLQLLRQFVSRLNPDILVVDEVHTFSVATEFLLALVKKQMEETKKKIKLVLMSATIDVELLKSFFNEVKDVAKEGVPSLDIPGRTFPVEKHYKEGDEFIPSILELAREKKNVLVFVEGKKAIDATIAELQENLSGYNIVPLHSELSINEQRAILNKPDKPTIVVATNIAQESITLGYINAVVDNGYCKEYRVNERGVPELKRVPISKADSEQRAGRAGRVMNGIYIRANNIPFEDIEDFPSGEIERITLEREILISLAIGFDPLKELKKAGKRKKVFIHNPNIRLLQISYDNLRKIGAINSDNKLTELGQELLNYPLDPKIAIMLLNGVKRGCTGNMIDICAILNHNSFIGKGEKWKNFVKGTFRQDSDLIGLSEFLKFVTSKEPLNSDIVRRLKDEGVNERQLKLYKILSSKSDKKLFTREELEKQIGGKIEDDIFNQVNESIKSGNKHMLFEIVDLSIIGVKSKKIYEILNTIDTLKERLTEKKIDISRKEYIETRGKEHNIKEKISKYNETLTRNVVRSILSGIMDNIFVWHKKEKKFYNDEMGGFNMPLNTLMKDFSDDSTKALYTGFPFIIGSTKKDEEDTPLLFFITKVNDGDITEVKHAFMQESFSGIKFGKKQVGITKRGNPKLSLKVIANMYRNIGSISLSTIIAEIPNEKLEDVISLYWFPDYMIKNNLAIKKYISKNPMINITRFTELLTLFTPKLYYMFNKSNITRTLNTFIHDSSLLHDFINSEDLRVKKFIENPSSECFEDDVIGERQSKKTEAELMLEQSELIKLLEKHEGVLEDNIELADQDFVLREAVLGNINDNKKIKKVRKITERQQKYKEKMEEEIRFIKEVAVKLNLTKIETNYYITQIRKKYKQLEESEGLRTQWYDDRKPTNFAGHIKLEIIDSVLDGDNDYISFDWLSKYLVQNNQSIIKYIKEREYEAKNVLEVFNYGRFMEILTLFFEPLFKGFYFNNIKKSLHLYKYDSSILDNVLNSKDKRVVEFLKNPFESKYNGEIDKVNTKLFIHNLPQFQREIIGDSRDRRKELLSNIGLNGHEDVITRSDEVYDKIFVREEKEKKVRKVVKKKKNNTNRELEILEMREKIRELKAKYKLGQLSKQGLFDQTREIEEMYGYKRIIRNRKLPKQNELKEETIEQKMNAEIDALLAEIKPLLKAKKNEGRITKEDLRKMINDIKGKYGVKKGKRKKEKAESDTESYVEPVKPQKTQFKRKTKIEFMWEEIDKTIKNLNSQGVSQEEIDKEIEKIKLSYNYIKPEVKPSAVVVKKEEDDNNPVEPTLNQAREGLSKRQYDESIRKLKKQARDENWTKEAFETEKNRLTAIFEETKQARIEANKNRPTQMERQKEKVLKMKKSD